MQNPFKNMWRKSKETFQDALAVSRSVMPHGKAGNLRSIMELPSYVLAIVLSGMVIGAGVLMLDKFSTTSGVTATASTAINNARTEVANIASQWLGLIVTISVVGFLLVLIVGAFAFGFMNKGR